MVAVVMSVHAVLLFSPHNCSISAKNRPAKNTSSKRTCELILRESCARWFANSTKEAAKTRLIRIDVRFSILSVTSLIPREKLLEER
jgi:hypothetical protein